MRYARKIFIVGFAVLMMFPQFLKAYAYDDADAYGGRGYVFGEYEKDEIIEKSEKDEKDKKDEKDETADEYGEGPDKDVTATETVYVSSPEEMNEAIENAGSENITAIILESDIDYGKMGSGAELVCISVPKDKNIVLDLNGYSITAELAANFINYTSVHVILNQGMLTITDGSDEGGGAVIDECETSYACTRTIKNTGDLTIEDVTVRSTGAVALLNVGRCIIYGEDTVIESVGNGGGSSWMNAAAAIENRTDNSLPEGLLVINDGVIRSVYCSAIYCDSTRAPFEVYGGVLEGSEKYGAVNGSAAAMAGKAYGGIWSSDPTALLADGYKIEKTGEGYEVYKEMDPETVTVKTVDELVDAINGASDRYPAYIVVAEDMTLDVSAELPEGSSIEVGKAVEFVICGDAVLSLKGEMINNGTLRVDGFIEDILNFKNNGEIEGLPYSGNKFVIDSPMDIQWLAYALENEGEREWHVSLEADISMPEGVVLNPMGHEDKGFDNSVFDGNGYEISGLVIRSSSGPAGMFKEAKKSVFKNFTVELDVEAEDDCAGGIVGRAEGGTKFENITVKGRVVSNNMRFGSGGIIGEAGDDDGAKEHIELIYCRNEAHIGGEDSVFSGSMIGSANGSRNNIELYNCEDAGAVEAASPGYIMGYGGMTAEFYVINFKSVSSDTMDPVGMMPPQIPSTISQEYYAVKNEDGWTWIENNEEALDGLEARIDAVDYTSVEAALADSSDGDTVTLLRNIESHGRARILDAEKDIVIDGCGYALKGDISIKIHNSAEVDIKDICFESSSGEDTGILNYAGVLGSMDEVSYISAVNFDGELKISNCVFTDCSSTAVVIKPSDGAGIVIENNVFDNRTRSECAGFIRIYSGYAVDFGAYISDNIFGGSTLGAALEVCYPMDADKIHLSGNYIESPNNVCVLDSDGDNIAEKAYPMAGEDLAVITDDVVIVKDESMGRAYKTLEDAVSSAKAGEEIYLLKNVLVEENVSIPADVSLDDNGKAIMLGKDGELTVYREIDKIAAADDGYDIVSLKTDDGAYIYMAAKEEPEDDNDDDYNDDNDDNDENDEEIDDDKEDGGGRENGVRHSYELPNREDMPDTDEEKDKHITDTSETDDKTVITTVTEDGIGSKTTYYGNGGCITEAVIPKKAVEYGKTAVLPIPPVAAGRDDMPAPVFLISIEDGESGRIKIPVENITAGTIAVLTGEDGRETVLSTAVTDETGIIFDVDGSAVIKVMDNTVIFKDVSNSFWGKDAIDYVVSRGIFAGTDKDMFSPDAPMSRAMLMTVLAVIDGQDIEGGEIWYEKALEWAVEKGISDGTAPEADITRQQFVSMLYRQASSPAVSGDLTGYADWDDVADYAENAMIWAVQNGIISGMGDGTIRPEGVTTRAQAASMIMRYINNSKK